MRALAADGQGEVIARGIVFANRGARFHVVGDDARIDDLDLGYSIRLLEGGARLGLVAEMAVIQQIVRMRGPDLRRAIGERGFIQPMAAGSVSHSMSMASMASRASSTVSATTAMESPT